MRHVLVRRCWHTLTTLPCCLLPTCGPIAFQLWQHVRVCVCVQLNNHVVGLLVEWLSLCLSVCVYSPVHRRDSFISLCLSAVHPDVRCSFGCCRPANTACRHSRQLWTNSYKNKMEQFRRIFCSTPVDTDRLLVGASALFLSRFDCGCIFVCRVD